MFERINVIFLTAFRLNQISKFILHQDNTTAQKAASIMGDFVLFYTNE